MEIRDFQYAIVDDNNGDVIAIFTEEVMAKVALGALSLSMVCDFSLQETLLSFHTTLDIEA